jgi:hypothetical protein
MMGDEDEVLKMSLAPEAVKEEPLYVIEGSRIRLSPDARHLAQMWGMSDHEMAKHLMQEARKRGER